MVAFTAATPPPRLSQARNRKMAFQLGSADQMAVSRLGWGPFDRGDVAGCTCGAEARSFYVASPKRTILPAVQ
jgi:hypothetical protein